MYKMKESGGVSYKFSFLVRELMKPRETISNEENVDVSTKMDALYRGCRSCTTVQLLGCLCLIASSTLNTSGPTITEGS